MTAGVRERSEWSGGPSDIEGKTTRVGASECGQRASFNRTREAGHLDEIQGVVANTLNLLRKGPFGFIDWLDDTRDKHSDAKHVLIAYDHADNARATKRHRVRRTRTGDTLGQATSMCRLRRRCGLA